MLRQAAAAVSILYILYIIYHYIIIIMIIIIFLFEPCEHRNFHRSSMICFSSHEEKNCMIYFFPRRGVRSSKAPGVVHLQTEDYCFISWVVPPPSNSGNEGL